MPTAFGRPAGFHKHKLFHSSYKMAAIVRSQKAAQILSHMCAVSSSRRASVRVATRQWLPNRTSLSPINGKGFHTSPTCERSLMIAEYRMIADSNRYIKAYEKRYTKDHEWIELSDDKTHGTIVPHLRYAPNANQPTIIGINDQSSYL